MTDVAETVPDGRTGWASWLLLALATLALAAALAFALTRSDLSGAPAGNGAATGAATDDLAALETRTRESPDDPGVWAALGEARFAANDFAGAADAFRRATTLAPAVAMHWSSLGEALVLGSRTEPLPDPALAAFRRALELDRRDPRARYFLAVKRDLDGDHRGALDDWLALLADTPRGAPWEAALRQTIEQVAAANGIDIAARLAAVRQPGAPQGAGPSAADAAAAAAMPRAEQERMIAQMLAQLEERLRRNPQQPDAWIMLMRSRMTLGQGERALDALRAAMTANPEEAARLRRAAQQLGVPGA